MHGYVYRTVAGVRIAEHRYVMQQHLGRPLWPDESVHHLNGVRTDNRLENLELWSRSQPSGQRLVDKLAWAEKLLARYRPHLLAAPRADTALPDPMDSPLERRLQAALPVVEFDGAIHARSA